MRLIVIRFDGKRFFCQINSNIVGKDQRTSLLYAGGAPTYKEKCDEAAVNDYTGFVLQ